MTTGRFATFVGILVVSLVIARKVQRVRHPHPAAPPKAAVHIHPAPSKTTPVASVSTPVPSVASSASRPPEPDALSEALCPDGMVLANGTTCAETRHVCKTRDASFPGGCLEYEPAHCRNGLSLRFCIDRDEYPNQEGMLPATMLTFEEAESACSEEGKRLCTEMEWLFACEGPTGFAFPYGDRRDPDACNVGKNVPPVRPEELWEPRDVAIVLERVDGRTAIGASSRCMSPLGVRDLVGNVEEWVKSDTTSEARGLRGGEYTGDPTCGAVRKMRTAGYRQFHTGFRCCRDPLVRVPARGPEPRGNLGPGVAPTPRFD